MHYSKKISLLDKIDLSIQGLGLISLLIIEFAIWVVSFSVLFSWCILIPYKSVVKYVNMQDTFWMYAVKMSTIFAIMMFSSIFYLAFRHHAGFLTKLVTQGPRITIYFKQEN